MREWVSRIRSSYRQPSVAIALHDVEAVWGGLRVLNLVNLIKLRGLGIKSHHGDKNIPSLLGIFYAPYGHVTSMLKRPNAYATLVSCSARLCHKDFQKDGVFRLSP